MIEYRCICMDPPWLERGAGKSKRGADKHYPLMGKKEILTTIRNSESWRPDRSGCHLWMWVTDNYLKDGLWIMECLGFRYVRTLVWVKMTTPELPITKTGFESSLIAKCSLQIGLGQYLRGSHELCLFGVMGEAMVPEPANRPPSVIFAPRTKHSQKPVEAFEVFEKVSPGPRLEMFARKNDRPGWYFWGNEV